jgi:phage shock protein PspC (stress-responsive transcriptional regulator)
MAGISPSGPEEMTAGTSPLRSLGAVAADLGLLLGYLVLTFMATALLGITAYMLWTLLISSQRRANLLGNPMHAYLRMWSGISRKLGISIDDSLIRLLFGLIVNFAFAIALSFLVIMMIFLWFIPVIGWASAASSLRAFFGLWWMSGHWFGMTPGFRGIRPQLPQAQLATTRAPEFEPNDPATTTEHLEGLFDVAESRIPDPMDAIGLGQTNNDLNTDQQN